MGLLDKLFGKKTAVVNLDEIISSIASGEEGIAEEPAKAYVKPVRLSSLTDVTVVVEELKAGNLVVADIRGLRARNPALLREIVGKLKQEVKANGGDLALLTEEKILVTPPGIKIIKRRAA